MGFKMSPGTKNFLRKLHRWGGLLVATYTIFYCITGIALNHRKTFGYFFNRPEEVFSVRPTDTEPLRRLVEQYKDLIGQSEDPTVIKIKESRMVEFLYGSHGKVRYVIYPEEGRVKRIEKQPIQPWHFINNFLHKAAGTSSMWVFYSDLFCIGLLGITLLGFFIFQYRTLDFVMVALGVLSLFIFMGVS